MANTPNFQQPSVGIGSYLYGIIPEDVAIAAGAFSYAMQQVKNIKNVDFEKFSQVAASIEITTANLNLINGTDVPVDVTLSREASTILQGGSGPYGTYTASDFFGCMSGLPYSWGELESAILNAQTKKLKNIYDQLFLAVTWEGPVAVPTYTTYDVSGTTYYTITGVTFTSNGGGYGRGSAPNPLITFSNGGTAYGVFGTDPNDAGSMGTGTYGRLTGITNLDSGVDPTTIPTIVSIEYPPTANLPVQSDGNIALAGSNTIDGTVGWPSPMNGVVDKYIEQANQEILYISQTKKQQINQLNTIYNYNGTQLKIEQRSRYSAIPAVPAPDRSRTLSTYPTSISSFVDNVGLQYAASTRPHMFAQTLEAIADLSTVPGQSLVGLMRQERNKARLDAIAIPLDNIIPDTNPNICEVLISNGTTPTAIPGAGIAVTGINGNVNNPTTTFTAPASLVQNTGSQPKLAPQPKGYFNPNNNKYISTTDVVPSQPVNSILSVVNISPNNNVNLLGPSKNGTGPASPINSNIVDPESIQSGICKRITDSVVNTEPIAVVTTGINKPTGNGQILDDGSATYPGSFAGSPETDLLPCELNSTYTSAVLLPSTLPTQQAIDEVIKCNCECWID